ncbi:hypothetical protein H4K36_01475 [Streptomyces sp. DHE7-1]|nr:hypothetical protein [Streptomyces sp. DHE7-1]
MAAATCAQRQEQRTQPPGSPPPPQAARNYGHADALAYVAAIAPGIVSAVYGRTPTTSTARRNVSTKRAYKGRSGAELHLDGVETDVVAQWNSHRDRVVVQLRSYFDENARFLRIDAYRVRRSEHRGSRLVSKDPEISVPVTDGLGDVTIRVAVGGKSWRKGMAPYSRTVRLSPTGTAYDAETGAKLPSDL